MSTVARLFAEILLDLTSPVGPLTITTSSDGLRRFTKGPQTLAELYAQALASYGPNTLLHVPILEPRGAGTASQSNTNVSYSDFFAEANRLASALRLSRGQRVAICAANCAEWLAAFVATTGTGGVACALNSLAARKELLEALDTCDPAVLILDALRAKRLGTANIRDMIQKRQVRVIVMSAEEESSAAAAAAGAETYSAVVATASPGTTTSFPPAPSAVAPSDDACIFFTSGTEGRAKGAISTHGAVLQSLLSFHLPGRAAAVLAAKAGGGGGAGSAARPPSSRLLATPLFHVSGCHTNFLMALFDGGRLAVMHRWDADVAVRMIAAERIAAFSGPPAMVADLLDRAGDADPATGVPSSTGYPSLDLSCLTSVGFGGSATPAPLIRRVVETLPNALPGTGWGGTETNGQGTTIFGPEWLAAPDYVGRPGPLVDIKVVDPETGRDLSGPGPVVTGPGVAGPGVAGPGVAGPGVVVGELCIRSACNMRCYFRNEEATRRATLGTAAPSQTHLQWYRTGDLGVVEADGRVRVVGRAKEVIIRGGENISAAEVESALMEHPTVRESCALGVPDEKLGEVVAAVVRLRAAFSNDGASGGNTNRLPLGEDIRGFLVSKGLLAAHKVPTIVHVLAAAVDFPRGPTGKILKRVLREQFDFATTTSSGEPRRGLSRL